MRIQSTKRDRINGESGGRYMRKAYKVVDADDDKVSAWYNEGRRINDRLLAIVGAPDGVVADFHAEQTSANETARVLLARGRRG